jgi:MYXO-CTERM domain-containing protein
MQTDGGALHPLMQPEAGHVIAGAGVGICSMGRAYGPGAMLFGILGVLGLRVARRRRR